MLINVWRSKLNGTGAGLSQWPGSDHMIEELNLSLLLGTGDQ